MTIATIVTEAEIIDPSTGEFRADWPCVCGCVAGKHDPAPGRLHVGECFGCPRCRVYFPASAVVEDRARRRDIILAHRRRADRRRRRSLVRLVDAG